MSALEAIRIKTDGAPLDGAGPRTEQVLRTVVAVPTEAVAAAPQT